MDDLDELARATRTPQYPHYASRPPAGSGWGIFHTIFAGLLVVALVIGMAFVYINEHPIGGAGGRGDGAAGLGEVTSSRTADELMDEYRENEVAADEHFRGRWVEVTGDVQSIRR